MITPERKAKIKWSCRRGMLELDLIFDRVLKKRLDAFTPEQVDVFERLLDCADPDLYAWFMGYEQPAHQEFIDFVDVIKRHDSF